MNALHHKGTHMLRQLLLRSIVIVSAVNAVPAFAQTAEPFTSAPATQPATQPAGVRAELPVKSVVLFSSGVGYFEHYGQVKGDGSTELRFKTAQINDILKSLVLQDLDGGFVSTVQYPSQDPIEKTLRSFQVDITGNPPLAELLNQLRGAKVTVSVGAEKYSGVILGVEKRPLVVAPDKPPVEQWIVNIINGASIRQLELNKINDVKLEDPALQEELSRALTALAQARDQDKKSVAINFRGEGDRRIRLGYVVESPIWKTSYRLLINDKETNLQGWAIVENQTDNDWNNVQLSLVSGRPISFMMNLYEPLYVSRPMVELELYQSLRPQKYDEAPDFSLQNQARDRVEKDGAARAPRAPAAADAAKKSEAQRGASGGGGVGFAGRPDDAAIDPNASVKSLASAAKLGELFQYTVGNVSLPRQKSAMIPIVTDKVTAERLSIYNQSVLAKHPLNGAMITNSTDKHLLQGPITVFDGGSYAGDAQIDNLPPGQKRLLSYGVDLNVLVQAEGKDASQLLTGKILKGVLQLKRKLVRSQTYTIQSKADREKTVVVEHPITRQWKLSETPDPFEKTDNLYRFKVVLPKGEQKKLSVQEELVTDEEIAIIPADVTALIAYSRQGELPEAVRTALTDLAKRRQTMVDLQRQIAEQNNQISGTATEQKRMRENMNAVDKGTAYYTRLLEKLNEQENQIDAAQLQVKTLTKQMNDARTDYEAFVQKLSVG
jgi:hypothetical protein